MTGLPRFARDDDGETDWIASFAKGGVAMTAEVRRDDGRGLVRGTGLVRT